MEKNCEKINKSTVCSATKKHTAKLSGCSYSLHNCSYKTRVLRTFDKNWCCKAVAGWSTNPLVYSLMLAPPQVCSFFNTEVIEFCRGESISTLLGWRVSLGLEWLGFAAEFFSLWQDLHYSRIAPVLVTPQRFSITPVAPGAWLLSPLLLGQVLFSFRSCFLSL